MQAYKSEKMYTVYDANGFPSSSHLIFYVRSLVFYVNCAQRLFSETACLNSGMNF